MEEQKTTEKKVDESWKQKAAEAMEKVDKQMEAEANVMAPDTPFVSVAEVKQYLTELSMVLNQISDGIGESIKTMDSRLDKGDNSNDKQD